MPLDEGDARILDEARDVEDLAEADARGVAADVGGDEDRDDGDATGDVPQVDEICVGDHIIHCVRGERR